MSQKYSQSSRDRRNGAQVQGGRDTYIREQRSYSQRESRYKVERFDRTFSNRMYVENQGGMRGMNYRQRGNNMNRNYRNFDDRRMRGGREMNRNYNNFNRPQGRMNQSLNYGDRRRGTYQRNNESFVRDRYSQRQRFSKERPLQDYNNSYKAEEPRQYDSSRAEQSSHQVESREKQKAVTHEESRPSEELEKVQSKKRARSSSSSSSSSSESSSDSEESSSSESSSSSEDEKKRKKRKKIAKKLKKAEKKRKKKKLKKKLKKMKTRKEKPTKEKKKIPKDKLEGNEPVVEKAKAMAPMTKEQWEKRQSVVRKVYDKETGRQRLIKGDGEVLEEIVSRDRHKEINRQATRGDGEYFQSQLRVSQ